MMRRKQTALAGATLLILAGCSLVSGPGSSNPACDQVGAEAATDALHRSVEAKPSPVEGFFWSCDYYPQGQKQALADLDLYDQDARKRYESDRESFARGAAETAFREENIGVPAYSRIEPDSALAGALDGDNYYRVGVFIDRYGETPESARDAAIRLLQQAIAA